MGSKSRWTPFAAYVGAATAVARPGRGHFVNFVDENNARIFGLTDGFLFHLVHVDELGRFFFQQDGAGFGNGDLAFFTALGHHVANHFLNVHHGQVIHRTAHHADIRGLGLLHVDVDFAVVHLAGADFFAETFAGAFVQFRVRIALVCHSRNQPVHSS